MCASYYDNVLFVGDNRDYMYWLDCSHGSFNILEVHFCDIIVMCNLILFKKILL